MRRVPRPVGALPGLLLLAVSASPAAAHSEDASPHRILRVAVSEGVELEVLDWGGSGPPLVFLAGLGSTAHVFDGFAPRFVGIARVVGITRRGFGASSPSPDGYGVDTLVQDIRTVLDVLGFERCVLAGHSFAGDEITRFAARLPDRVQGAIYLDAAHDRSGLASLAAAVPYPPPPPLTSEDSASIEGWRKYLRRYRGVDFPPGEVQANLLPSDSGTGPIRVRDDGEVISEILNGIRAPDFAAFHVPILAIFAVPSGPADMFPYMEEMTPSDRREAQRAWSVYHSWERDQIERLERTVPSATVHVVDGGNHFIFLSHPGDVARLVRGFLKGLDPGVGSAAGPGRARGEGLGHRREGVGAVPVEDDVQPVLELEPLGVDGRALVPSARSRRAARRLRGKNSIALPARREHSFL